MGWRQVIITQHAKLTYSSHMMIVQTKDGINQIPISDINLLLISTSQAVITSALISELTKQNAKIICVDDKYQPICETVSYYPSSSSRQKLIKEFNWDNTRKELLWTKIISSKICNQIQVLDNYNKDFSGVKKSLEELEINDPTNREAVAARIYFLNLFENDFIRRNNTVMNAALDYGYSILLSAFNREIAVNGYSTYLGIHHHSDQNQFNLGSDLMEPFRPFVDYWLAAHMNITDFTPDIKYGLVELLSLQISFNGKTSILSNAIAFYVQDCLHYLNGEVDDIKIEMTITDEIPNNAINDNV